MGRELGRLGPSGEIRTEIRGALQRGAVVVTGNERAARTLRREYDELQRTGGAERWEPARVLSWAAWTRSLWRRMLLEGRATGLLLNAFQEQALWRRVLEEDQDARGLRGVGELAEMAAKAWGRLWAYADAATDVRASKGGISGLLQRESRNADTDAFARWARTFEERCRAERMVTEAQLDGVLAGAVEARELRLEEPLVMLAGFDRLLPSQDRLLRALRAAETTVEDAPAGGAPTRTLLTAAADEAAELRACARWAARWMSRRPAARIAVIVPDLAAERSGLERTFREVLAPEMESIVAPEQAAAYEFSLGRALAESPMVTVALLLLRWAGGALPMERVSGLLVSGYFAAAREERGARAEFDAFGLRRAEVLRPEMTLAEMTRQVSGWKRSSKLPELASALRRMERRAAGLGGVTQSYSRWAEAMRGLLEEAGWRAEGMETSAEFQERERWESALDAMATLDFDDRTVEYGEALRAIEGIARKTVFAAESRGAPVQVMGVIEAAGGEFDAVWFLRAGELSWPMVQGSLPLLPWGLQQDLGMPGTDAARDLEEAKRTTARIVASGGEVVVSYARHSGEVEQRASAVVRGLGLEEVGTEELAGPEPTRAVIEMEQMVEAGQVRALPDEVVRGGARVLELQAACGFRAFAEQRLWSSELEGRELGLNARESGTVVHRVLESFWAEVRTQGALLAMSPEERRAAMSRAVEEGLRGTDRREGGDWDAAYLATLRERLQRLLRGWLEVEEQRPAFEVIESEEVFQDVPVGPLRLQLRIDRADVVDGTQVLVDYKTGAAETKDWLGERPDAPQVPLYAILAARKESEGTPGAEPMELGAVAFANVRAGKGAQLKGFAARGGLLPGRLGAMDAETFAGQVELWGEVLERLAEDFAAGDARVRPKNYPGTCGRCGQRILCRLDASLLEEIEDETEGESSGG